MISQPMISTTTFLMLPEAEPEIRLAEDLTKIVIGNKNTKKNHYTDCSAVNMMIEENKVIPDPAYDDCSWCKAKMKKITLDDFEPEYIEDLPDRNFVDDTRKAVEGTIKCQCNEYADYFNTSDQRFYCTECKTKICSECWIENCHECFLEIEQGE